ncbi:MAG: hypothetical protein RMJ05_08005 [Thermomicrobium sp.]|nr:hypothetical protein [Thermomicrobium sp.]MDW8006651.1 hypothetical protein [Thermomicrobium sp.]
MVRRRRRTLFRVLPAAGKGVVRTIDWRWFPVGSVVDLPHLSEAQLHELVMRGVIEPVETDEQEMGQEGQEVNDGSHHGS